MGGPQGPTSLNLTTGAVQTFAYTCTAPNNVIDTTNYVYALNITDQSGPNSRPMIYVGYQLFFSQIPQLAFP